MVKPQIRHTEARCTPDAATAAGGGLRIGFQQASSRSRLASDEMVMNGPRHILVVGADVALRDMLAHALGNGGAFRVTEASSAAEAVVRAQARHHRLDPINVLTTLTDADTTR